MPDMTSKGAIAFASVVFLLALPAVAQTTQPAAADPAPDYAALLEGEPTIGINTLKERVKIAPRDGDALHVLGILHLKSSKASEATGYFTRAAACGVAGPAIAYNQALAFLRTGQALRAAGLMAKHLQSGGAADERFVDLFGDSIDRSFRTASISTTSTKQNWDDLLSSRIQSLEQSHAGMRKWGTKWMTSAEYGPIQTSIREFNDRFRNAESNYDRAVNERKDAESNARVAAKNVPDVSSTDTWLKRVRSEDLNRAKENVRRCAQLERDAKRDLDQLRNTGPRPVWEDKHAPSGATSLTRDRLLQPLLLPPRAWLPMPAPRLPGA